MLEGREPSRRNDVETGVGIGAKEYSGATASGRAPNGTEYALKNATGGKSGCYTHITETLISQAEAFDLVLWIVRNY